MQCNSRSYQKPPVLQAIHTKPKNTTSSPDEESEFEEEEEIDLFKNFKG